MIRKNAQKGRLARKRASRPLADYAFLWQAPAMGQLLQPQPQEDFPCFLSLRIFMMAAATIPISMRLTRMVPALSTIACSM